MTNRPAMHRTDGERLDSMWGNQRLLDESAAQASRELRERMDAAIFKWGFRHGIDREQARVLLLDRRMP
jgi:hypothetical protein